MTDRNPTIDPTALAALGEGHVAYVRPMTADDVKRLFPQAPDLTPGLNLFALLSASGAPILLTDSRDAAIANAWAHDLQAVSVH
ncbi:protein of unknown function DUF1150 [Methylobacterium sp. 4-46]|uniref:BQ00720 family protein n=1 Tax=unclassified Methylobacterium TaxID=2615210 RepID=UPI000152CA58|nr:MULTISPECIES: DUF1150 domain-containing protein [Methylobacterium]ACA18578.1 protein of unknown function DUF1150 [Methylobacterium sp. 4-46]WFT77861.1 DUF1150 domain-containing protein [Methylobacterium nodulans]